jgi:thiamine biosynthesis lipoprotein
MAMDPEGWSRLEFNRPQMGVPFRMVVWTPKEDEARAQAAVGRAYERVEALNGVFSDYDPDSEISILGRTAIPGEGYPVSADLAGLLQRAQALAQATGGAFDVTVGPLANLWRRARRLRELPPEHLLAEARARVGWRFLEVDQRRQEVVVHRDHLRLDFGGIAKGFAADEALRVLRDDGFDRALVAAAGDVTVGEAPPGQVGWRVTVGGGEAPGDPASLPVLLRWGSVSTSGDLYQRLEIGGRRYSHILDPRTGLGLTDHSLVTVIARDGTTSDSLATAVSVLGPEEGLRLVEKTPGAAVWVVRGPDGQREEWRSRRWSRWVPVDGGR